MSFDGALGNMQIASDFRVVASLEQKIDNLPLSGPHLVKLLVHGLHLTGAPVAVGVASNQVRTRLEFGSLTASFCNHKTNLTVGC